ncbi:MAG: calcineurin-like phosphoesterase C-terminal domain-containing protein [Prevotella sp.]|nr:calcineurin-like phosphoesterase C-terminal domain-containing protein [Prevotella sp.]
MAILSPLMGCANMEVSSAKENDNFVEATPANYTVTGRVTCEGKPLAGVEVSDGVDVVLTNASGEYQLNAKRALGYVFVTLPSGYEPEMKGNALQFYKRLSPQDDNTVDVADFSLKKVNNDKHAIFTLADCHLAGQNNDVEQFHKVADDINGSIKELRAQGYKVYGISLGDESWDVYWYSNKYTIKDAYTDMQAIDAPVFHNMGNHDGNPYLVGDRRSAQTFIDVCGPTYYSFNIGKVHYVVLDNIEYLNDGGAEGVIGQCNYNERVVDVQMEWLRKDLALIKDPSTPIVIAMHSLIYHHPSLVNDHETHTYLLSNGNELERMLSRFTNVQVLSGHLHKAHNIQPSAHLIDHNVPAISATWWWTEKLSGNSVCQDGAPGGYGIFRWDGHSLDWYYKSSFFDKSYQFRAYDLNTTYIDPRHYAPQYVKDMTHFAREYATPRHDNRVLINVWNYDPLWKVEVMEGNSPLVVTRVEAYDPLHIISYDAPRVKAGGSGKVQFPTVKTSHMFMVQARRSNSTLHIRVTDRFGNVYTEEMVRPKAFDVSM